MNPDKYVAKKQALVCFTIVILFTCGWIMYLTWQLGSLDARIGCLEHPHGESSVSATKVGGKWIVSKPTRTGC